MANLNSYTSVRTNLFVELTIDEYRTTSSGTFTTQTLRFSDSSDSETVNGDTYTPLGTLLNITATSSEISPTTNTVSVSVSGIPNTSIPEIVYSRIKGCDLKIYRKFKTIAGVDIETAGYFLGKVTNYSIQEDYDVETRTASNIIILECATDVSILEKKIAGRKTNPISEQTFFPSDTAMDRVPTLKGTRFDFGAP